MRFTGIAYKKAYVVRCSVCVAIFFALSALMSSPILADEVAPQSDAGVAVDPLVPVYTNDIKVGGFWKVQFKRITEKWLPHCIEQMEEGGRGQELMNLVYTAKVLRGEEHGKYTGAPWSDAYVYNTVEAICLALAIEPEGDKELAEAQAHLREKMRSGFRSFWPRRWTAAISIHITR